MRTNLVPIRPVAPPSRHGAVPGFRRLSWAEYAASPALSRSVLDKIRVSPQHLQHYLAHGDEDTTALVEGRVFHAVVEKALTGRDVVSERVAVWEGERRAGKVWDAFEIANADRDIVRASDMERISRMAGAVLNHPLARRLLNGSTIEAAAFWKDERTGVECKALIDVVHGLMLYDLKTTSDISYEAFARSAFNFGYFRQAAFYLEGARAATGVNFLGFGNIVVEKTAPYAVQVFHFDDAALKRGAAENRSNLNLYAACKASNTWPGPAGDEPQTLSLPWRA